MFTQELEDCEARINSLVQIPSEDESKEEEKRATEAPLVDNTEDDDSFDDASVGEDEDNAINKSVLKRESSPVCYMGRPQSPGSNFTRPTSRLST